MKRKSPLIAAIDIGTNSVHLVVADVNNRQNLNIILREKEMVRLGSGATDMKHLSNDAMARAVATLLHFSQIARAEGALVRAVATSAVREALNHHTFIEMVKHETGIDVEIISGLEEARLIYIGAIHSIPVYDKKVLLIDIGGGSTETVIGLKGDILISDSHKLGAIRLTKRFFPNSTITNNEIQQCREYIIGEWAPALKHCTEHDFTEVVGTSGTIMNLVAMVLTMNDEKVPENFNGISVSSADLLKTISKILKSQTLKSREKLPGMDPARADIITAGSLIIEQFLIQLNIKKITISSFALREGIVFDTAEKMESATEPKRLSHLRQESVEHLCRIYMVNIEHAEHIKKIARRLFDVLQPLHKYGFLELEYLDAASMLHDVGYHVSRDQHHKHSYYLIKNSPLPGFTNDEAEIIANIARYHRKSHPKKKHLEFAELSPERQKLVRVLSSMLRIAEGIDRRQLGNVEDIECKLENYVLKVKLIPAPNAELPDIELWGAERRKPLMEETFFIKVQFELGNEIQI